MNLHPSRDRDEWRPEDEYPYQPPSNGRPPRRSRRKPSLLDAIKEEEIVSETLAMPPVKIEAAPAPAPKLELTPRKRRKTAKIDCAYRANGAPFVTPRANGVLKCVLITLVRAVGVQMVCCRPARHT